MSEKVKKKEIIRGFNLLVDHFKRTKTVSEEDLLNLVTEKEELLTIFKLLIDYFKRTNAISQQEILDIVTEKKEILIPVSIFSFSLAPLQSLVKYLKEHLDLTYNKIASLTNRNNGVIWKTYNESKKKYSRRFRIEEESYFIPLSVFANIKLSILENIVFYLKNNLKISFKQIGALLNKKPSTIFTAYSRAKNKNHEVNKKK